MGYQTKTAAIASSGIRLFAYVFLRWAAMPPLIFLSYALFAIYVPAFIASYRGEPGVVIVDEIDVKARPTLLNEDESNRGESDQAVIGEEVQVTETVTLLERQPSRLATLLGGVPNPRNLLSTLVTFLANAGCILMITDAVYSPKWKHPSDDLSFARLGFVSDTEAKLLVREPDQSKMPISVQVHVKDAVPPFDSPLWRTVAEVQRTSKETDHTAVVTIPLMHLEPRIYEWSTSNNHSGEFAAAPRAGTMPRSGKFTFLATSCILARLPYSPTDHPLAVPGMRQLGKVLKSFGAQGVQFMLFLGDFIYIDVPSRFGKSVEAYRQKYRQVYASPDWPAVGQNLSWIHVIDDHEIANDWDQKSAGVYEAAVEPWHHYQTAVNPPPARSLAGISRDRTQATYFSFVQGPASFFLADTRSYRSENAEAADSPHKTMLGKQQLEDFLHWLRSPEAKGVKWKIVGSSVPVTKNWRVNTRDTWGGFLHERQIILEAMWDAGLQGYGVVIVSGDRHEFGATAFPPPKGGKWSDSVTVHEFCTSPLNQFYSPIPTYRQTDETDVEMKYINTGNSKFGALTIESLADGEQSSLRFQLFVDGVESWNTIIVTPTPAPGARPVAAGSLWDKIRGVGAPRG